MDPNCKSKFNLDHVYCHPNENNYIRANAGSAEVLSILKENKQLKAMLLLHLDLIQEQSDQLMTKEKHLTSLREENECLKLRLERMDRRLQLKNKVVEPAPPVLPVATVNEEKKENIPKVKTYSRVSITTSPSAQPTVTRPSLPAVQSATNVESKYKICDETYNVDSSVIGENNGKFITKIILQRVQAPGEGPDYAFESGVCAVEDTATSCNEVTEKTELVSVSQDTEDSFSCGSGEPDRQLLLHSVHKLPSRHGTMSTSRSYCTREWETEKIDEEINREETEVLKSEAPNLEIPKWTIRDYSGLYAIEGTEDLSDDVFLKRHNKLEMDEKRRKKWDVQRIREQRTIERLKRRHYKEEVNETESNQIQNSFYPSADSIKYIQIAEEIPVNAFGELIPSITDEDFLLPWSELSPRAVAPLASVADAGALGVCSGGNGGGGGGPGPNTMLFVLKKRRRQHLSNAAANSKRPNRKLVIKN